MTLPHPLRPRPAQAFLLLFVLAAWACLPAAAQTPAEGENGPDAGTTDASVQSAEALPAGAEPTLDIELIERRIAEAEADTALAEEAKTRRLERYRSILSNLADTESSRARAAAFREAIAAAPRAAAAIRDDIEQTAPLPEPPVDLPADIGLAEIENLLTATSAEAASLEAHVAELTKTLEEQEQQPALARERLAAARQELKEVESELQAPAQTQADATVEQINRWLLESRRDALRAEILMLEQQVLSADARRELTQARRDRTALLLERVKARRAFLHDQADRLRRLEAERIRTETAAAERELAGAPAPLRTLAEANAALAGEINVLTGKLDRVDEQEAAVEQTIAQVTEDFRSARRRLEVAGLNRAMGQVLIDQRNDLPDLRAWRVAGAKRAETIADSTLRQLHFRDELRNLASPDTFLGRLLAAVPEAQREAALPLLREQVERRQELLERAISVEDTWLRALSELDFAATQLVDTVAEYEDFLAERLLWVRSSGPITDQPFRALPEAVLWLIDPRNWWGVIAVLGYEALHTPILWLGVGLVAVLIARARALRRGIRASAEPLRRVSTDRFAHTLKAIGLTLLLAAPWPLLSALIGWRLNASLEATVFTKALGQGLVAIALPAYYLRAFQVLCMNGGVADRHFRWTSEVLRKLRLDIDLATFVLLPIALVATAIHQAQNPAFSGTLGRLALVALTLGLAALTARVLHPSRGVLSGVLSAHPQGWLNRLRTIWYALLVGVPAVLAVLVLIGYQYTAATLLRSLVEELWLALVLVVVHQTIVRWLMVTRRSLALTAALERRASRETQKEAAAKGAQSLALPPADTEADLATLDSQTRRLVNSMIAVAAAVGLWLIWSEVVPALNVFDRVTLWNYTRGPEGATEVVPVTLADLGLIVVIFVVATIAGRNLPALLEILLLKNPSVSAGSRYTITTLTGYVITAIGALLVFNALGLSWGQVQWLVAALGVGIGFGLQEIVANFISGLIILFERPVRVGDIVTIGDTTGVVSKIEIRATTIRNWDKQELLVPNKEFITGRLLNWSLTDQLNRILVTVGVAYGSDTRKAMAILAEAADENSHVIKDPEPIVTFEGFGDNSLTLVLRCYLDNLDYRLTVTTELHQAVNDKLEAAGISIAFPQRDIHLRSAEPVDVRLHRAGRGGHGPQAPDAQPG